MAPCKARPARQNNAMLRQSHAAKAKPEPPKEIAACQAEVEVVGIHDLISDRPHDDAPV